MAKVFSWKIAPGKYSYLIEENGSFIRSRITDSQTLYDMANIVDGWSESEYNNAFARMRAEVESKYGTVFETLDYYTIGEIDNGTVVLLTGKDGSGSGPGGDSDGGETPDRDGQPPVLSEPDYKKIKDILEKEFQKYKDEIEQEIDIIRQGIEDALNGDIRDAMRRINDARRELTELDNRLQDAMNKAQGALDAARGLQGLSDGDITPEKLINILSMTGEMRDWIERFDGKIATLLADYDRASGNLGGMGIGVDVSKGVFSLMLENINTLNGTVGSIGTSWGADSGAWATIGTWYNESAGTYAEAVRLLDASRAAIEDIVNFKNLLGTTSIKSYIDGELAEMGRRISHLSSGGDVTDITEKLNALSALVETTISHYGASGTDLTNIIDRLNGLDASARKAIEDINFVSGTAKMMQDEWTQDMGMVRSVTDFVIRKDEQGKDIYWYIDANLESEEVGSLDNPLRVYLMLDDQGMPLLDENGKVMYVDSASTIYSGTSAENVVPDFMSTMMSYISQKSDSIHVTVTSGDIISSLGLTVDDEGSRINMTADKVVIDSDVFTDSIIANGANIGGIHMGEGIISAGTPGGKRWVLTGDGDLYAENGYFNGTVTASDIIMDGKSLKMWGNDGSNNFEIGDKIIDVKHVPATITISAVEEWFTAYTTSQLEQYKSDNVEFRATGNTTVYLPTVSFSTCVGSPTDYVQDEYRITVQLDCIVTSGSTTPSQVWGQTLANDAWDLAICHGSNTTELVFPQGSRGAVFLTNFACPFSGTNSNYVTPLKCLPDRSYSVAYRVTFKSIGNTTEIHFAIPDIAFINAPNPVNTRFFNIGRNGMQIFLGNGFYFTAAYDNSTYRPIIAMGGLKGQQMFGLKLDPDGIKVLRGNPGVGWEDI